MNLLSESSGRCLKKTNSRRKRRKRKMRRRRVKNDSLVIYFIDFEVE